MSLLKTRIKRLHYENFQELYSRSEKKTIYKKIKEKTTKERK